MQDATAARDRTPAPVIVTDRQVIIAGVPFVRPGVAAELLAEGTHLSPLTAYDRLKKAALVGDVEVVRIHARSQLYSEADVLDLRARLLAGG